jgi:hypothetical protein
MSQPTAETALPLTTGPCAPSSTPLVGVTPAIASVPLGSTVLLKGIAEQVDVSEECRISTKPCSFIWKLYFQQPPAPATDDTRNLHGPTTLTPSFIAAKSGIYTAELTACGEKKESLITVMPPTRILEATGQVTLLRAHDVGTGYGKPPDVIDVEVVAHLSTEPGKAFGFKLREDNEFPARRAMFDLLRDAYNAQQTVTIDYLHVPGQNNSVIIRVWRP